MVEHRANGESYLIECKVIRQTSVSSTLYTTKLWINGKRKVINQSCTYVYNESLSCKHTAALIYFINNERSLTKTSNVESSSGTS